MSLVSSISGFFGGKGNNKPSDEPTHRGYNPAELSTLRETMAVLKDVNQASYNLITVMAHATPNPHHPEDVQKVAQEIIAKINEIYEKAAETFIDAMQTDTEGAAKLSSTHFNVVAAQSKNSEKPLSSEEKETVLSIAKGLVTDGLQLNSVIDLYEGNAKWLLIKDGDEHYRRAIATRDLLRNKTSKDMMEMVLGMTPQPS